MTAKAKFAIKVALSITLTYLFILAMGLEYASVAVMTIMLIASPSGVKDALAKGLLRIGGTIIGAIIGMSLISLFPQQPLYYLVSLSLVVTFLLYLRNAYTGDNTLFMLSAMTTMAVFDNGNIDTVFMYGIDRTFITILAITVYTLIFFLIWPSSSMKNEEPDIDITSLSFIWLDIEHLKGALQTFCIFWASTAFWYYLNPPGGFMIVMLATGFSALTSFSPVKPSAMAIVINISLFLAILIYIFILPNLTHWIELSILLFAYTFFAFYFFPPMLSIIVLIGLNTLMITNTMSYHVDLFLGIVLMLDMVFAFLILAYYFPFSSKPEHLYITTTKRFLTLSRLLNHPNPFIGWYAKTHQKRSLNKLSLWGSKLDFAYFNTLDSDQITTLKERFNDLLRTLKHHTPSRHESQKLSELLHQWSCHIDTPSPDKKHPSIPLFHPYIRKNILECHHALYAINWHHLKQGRF
jgi:hypothetical protein